MTAAVVLAAGMALLASCGSGSGTPAAPSGASPIQSTAAIQITTSRALSPAFDPNISDYVVAYKAGSPLQVSVNAPANTTVSVDAQPFRELAFTTQVTVTPGQSFSFVVHSPGGSNAYSVRCLPTDFPAWATERLGTPQAEYYIFAPNEAISSGTPSNYVIISDGYGVPIWWYHSIGMPVDAKLLPNGNIAWTSSPLGEEHLLDGSLARTFVAASPAGATLDVHELQLLPNGDYLFIADVERGPVDLSAYGGSASGTVLDTVIEETSPSGSLVWSWSPMDHVSLSETGARWRSQYVVNAHPADPYHMNSVEPDGDGFVVSLRHLDAVIRIDRATGNIAWKLGGSARPESLAFTRDAYGNFGGQHDARVLPDGTLTVHDNGSLLGRAPRAARYSIDTLARTATFVEQVTDPDAPQSICCGSARKLAGGDWVMSWGDNLFVTELTPAGKRIFRMTLQVPFFSYRADPVPFGALSRAALRNGMNAQFPR